MTEMRNCKKCGSLYQYYGNTQLCSACFQQDEADYQTIRQYLVEHPGAKMFEVSTILDITVNRIKRYLREDRLQIVEKNNGFLRCETCGRSIQSGQYCEECLDKSKHDFKVIYCGHLKPKTEHRVNYRSNTYGTDKIKKFAAR
jgi:uncharacterized protein